MGTLRRVWRELGTPMGVAAAATLAGLLALAIVGPIVWGAAATTSDPLSISQPPSAEHPFGTDAGGRDILLRTIVATRLSVAMALVAVVVGVATGVVLGTLPLLVGRRLSRVIVAFINIGVAFPGLLLAISFSVILGQNAIAATFAIAFAMAPSYARLTYTLSASAWGRDYVSAARVLGVPRPVIVLRHVLPNVRDPLLVNATISAGVALVSFAGLSFLGLGVQAPEYDWGRMLNEGLGRVFVSPAAALVPGVAIILAGLVFTLVGETLNRALTPGSSHARRSRRSRTTMDDTRRHDEAPLVDGALADGDPVLEVRGLQVSAPHSDGAPILVDDVTFSVGRGEMVGIVGESGSGKSMTLMAIAGLLETPIDVAARRLAFDGDELPARADGWSPRVARRVGTRMSMVFQDPMASLNPAITVGRQIAEVGALHLGLRGRASRERALAAMAEARIPEPERRFDQYPHELSGGLRQRAVIAMGLVATPALLLADEPTTALDVTVQARVLDLLRDVNRSEGTAVLFVSHDIAVVASLCTRVLVMRGGRLLECLTSDALRAGAAKHPYTRALLAAVPTMTTDRDAPLATIGGDELDAGGRR